MANFDKDSESFVKCILYQFEIIWKTLSKCFDVHIHGFSGLDIFSAPPLYGWLNTHFNGEPGYIWTAHCFWFGINSEIWHWVWVFYINFLIFYDVILLWCQKAWNMWKLRTCIFIQKSSLWPNILSAYLIFVTDATDNVCVKKSVWGVEFARLNAKGAYLTFLGVL